MATFPGAKLRGRQSVDGSRRPPLQISQIDEIGSGSKSGLHRIAIGKTGGHAGHGHHLRPPGHQLQRVVERPWHTQHHRIGPGSTIYMPANALVSYQNGDAPLVAIQVFAGPAPAAKYDAWEVVP